MKFGRVLLIGFGLVLSSELTAAQPRTGPSHDVKPPNNAATLPVSLDIPSQSLELALKPFSDATHIALVHESSVIAGRRSFGLRGAGIAW